MKISDLLAVKIENTILKLEQIQRNGEVVVAEQARLIAAARKASKASAAAQYNPNTQSFEEPSAPEVS